MANPKRPAAPTGRTCLNCPSVIEPKNQAEVIGGVIGSPMCGRFMKILTRPQQPIDVAHNVLKDTARKCDKYGQTVKVMPVSSEDPVRLPIGVDADAKEQSQLDKEATNPNCHTCSNFIPANQVMQKFGWSQPACRATGSLMVDSHLGANARTCGKYVYHVGARRSANLDSFILLPIFSEKYGVVDLAKLYLDRVSAHIDRAKYESDKPVGPKAKAAGVRAWRKIEDPLEYGEPVYLPIFDPDAKVENEGNMEPLFTKKELELIPQTGDDEHPELYADHGSLIYRLAVILMKLDDTPAAWGQGGTGKTEIARHISWLCGFPFHRISINGSSEIDDIAGKYVFVNNETVIHWGRLSAAWQRPGFILLDEPNTGPNDIWQMIRALTDNSRMLVVDHLDATRVKRHAYCMFMMAMNPSWDVRNAGTHDVADADLSRLAHIYFDLPPRDLEAAIIRKRVELDGWSIPDDKLNMVMDVSRDIREASANGALQFTWGIRHNIRVARNLRFFNGPLAYRMTIGDAMEPAQLEKLNQFVTSQFGD